MIEIIVLSVIGVLNIIGIIIFKKLIKEKPDCVSKCCNVEVEENINYSK